MLGEGDLEDVADCLAGIEEVDFLSNLQHLLLPVPPLLSPISLLLYPCLPLLYHLEQLLLEVEALVEDVLCYCDTLALLLRLLLLTQQQLPPA